jgi:hypothetical protein
VRFEIVPFAATVERGFVRIGVLPMMILLHDSVVAALSSDRLGQLLRQAAQSAVILDLSTAARGEIEPKTAEWIATTWSALLPSVGVHKLAVVLHPQEAQLVPILQRVSAIECRVFSAEQRDALEAFIPPPPAAPPPTRSFAESGSEDLTLPPRAWYYAGTWGGIVGAALGAAFWASAHRAFFSTRAESFELIVPAVAGCLIGTASVYVVHVLRNVPRGRVTWDEEGITEWAGDKPITTIAWPSAQFALLEKTLTYQSTGQRSVGQTFQISDGSGKTITLCTGFQRPDWLNNRPAQVAYLPKYQSMVTRPRQPMVIVPDKLGYGKVGFVLFGIIALASYAAFGVGAAGTHVGERSAEVLLAAGCVLFAIRAVWPATRLGSRAKLSAIVEIALRLVVIGAFAAVAATLATKR